MHIKGIESCTPGSEASVVAPDWDGAVPEGCNPHIHMHPESAHQAPDSPHQAEDGHVPDIVEHALPVQRQAVCVQPKIPVPSKVRAQDVLRVLLNRQARRFNQRRAEGAHWLEGASSASTQRLGIGLDLKFVSPGLGNIKW